MFWERPQPTTTTLPCPSPTQSPRIMRVYSSFRTGAFLMALSTARAEMGFEGGYWRRATSGGPSTFVIPLAQDKNGFYHSTVHMGSDLQTFNFSLSASTGYTVVAGQVCMACGDQNPLYSSKNSSSFQLMHELIDISVDGVNQVFGNLAKENCALKQTNGQWWKYNNQTILVAGSVNDGTRNIFTPEVSGIIGLAPNARARTSADTILGAWLLRNPQAEKVSVGFALGRPETGNTTTGSTNSTATNSTSSDAGEMHLLAPDSSSYYGSLVTVPTVSYESTGGPTFGTGGGQQMQAAGWVTNLEQWSFLNSNGDRVDGGRGAVAAVDPWYSGIIMPKNESESVFARIPGSQLVQSPNAAQQTWNIPCNTRMNLSITIAGMEFDIDPRDLIVEGETSGGSARKRQGALCPCNVQGWADATVPGYMLGSSFMRNAYVVYNAAQSNSSQQNSIGFGNRRFPFQRPSPQQSRRARMIGAIVGSIAGTLALLGGAALGWLWWRSRDKAHRAPSDEFMGDSPTRYTSGGKGFFAKGGVTVAPGVIFSVKETRRGSDPEAYPLMQTPPTTSSPPRDGAPPKTFAHQQGPVVQVEDADREQGLHMAAHQAYLDRVSQRAGGTGNRWSSSGYSRIEDNDVDAYAFGDHAQVYGSGNEPEHNPAVPQRYDPVPPPAWEQPYYPPAPAAGERVSMIVEPIAKPPEAAQKEDTSRAT